MNNLYLIPCILAPKTEHLLATDEVKSSIKKSDLFLVENIRTARRYISSLKLGLCIEDLLFYELDKKTNPREIEKHFKQNKNIGVLSEAGCPGIADPGAVAVELGHKYGYNIKPLTGPNSITLALMGSGFNGQCFKFHGYLPIKNPERKKAIKSLELESAKFLQTQIFIETPYRNNKLFEDIIQICSKATKLCIGCNLTGEDQILKTKTIKAWKEEKIELGKKPTIFLILA